MNKLSVCFGPSYMATSGITRVLNKVL